jgi:hypothetical protein
MKTSLSIEQHSLGTLKHHILYSCSQRLIPSRRRSGEFADFQMMLSGIDHIIPFKISNSLQDPSRISQSAVISPLLLRMARNFVGAKRIVGLAAEHGFACNIAS